jgi:hypothetical protein
MAERLDAWRTANREIRAAGGWDTPEPAPFDVLQLAQFLAGNPAD